MVPGVATQHRMGLFKVDLLQGASFPRKRESSDFVLSRHSRERGNPWTLLSLVISRESGKPVTLF
jgi:hypothetical protein